jgi:hypothetical protein
MLFASGIEDESLSLISAKAEGPNNHVYPLAVEAVRKVPGFDWLTEVIVLLPSSVDSSGDFGFTLTYRGRVGNKAVLALVQ